MKHGKRKMIFRFPYFFEKNTTFFAVTYIIMHKYFIEMFDLSTDTGLKICF